MNNPKAILLLSLLLSLTVLLSGASAQNGDQESPDFHSADSLANPFIFRTTNIPFLLKTPDSSALNLTPWRSAPPAANLQFDVFSPALWKFNQKMPMPSSFYRSAWEQDFAKRAHGGYSDFRLDPGLLLSQYGEKREWERGSHQFHNDFIPSTLQLQTLNFLWNQPLATQKEIYASLDSVVSITAEQLDWQLERMVTLGLVERKMISPQNLFTIGLPLHAFQVEMSAENRRNRVYLYRSSVEKQQILQQLLARSNQIGEEGIDPSGERQRLTEKIKLLLFSDAY